MPNVRLIIAGTRPPKEIRQSEHALEQWYEDHFDRVQPMVDAALRQFGFRQQDIIEEICGEAAGWDTLGRRWAECEGIEVIGFPAEWHATGTYNPKAGIERNMSMAMYAACEQPEVQGLLVAAWDGKSAGTRNMVWSADKQGLKTWCWADGEGEFDGRCWD
jgi:hypothetical protein